MKREKEVPADLLIWLNHKQHETVNTATFNNLTLFCTIPVKAVKMRILEPNGKDEDGFHTVIIPAIDIYTAGKAYLKSGFLKRNSLLFFVAGTRHVFPYGHIYAGSGSICLGNIFVPSAVPEKSPTMPIETLFLHNDRNLSHGDSHLRITRTQAALIQNILNTMNIKLSKRSWDVVENPGYDIIRNDQIWCMSADVAKQKCFPEALRIMTDIYKIIFPRDSLS